jgi:O-acetyl-ADP-ribose deacetylase (regulator of RNase III)
MDAIKAISEIPSLPLLYRTQTLLPALTPRAAPNAAYNAKIALVRYDITRLGVACIVNAANSSLLGGGGVDGAIHRAAGPRLLDECETLGGCETGNAKITDGYRLPANKIVHAVGPIYWKEKGRGRHEALLRGCYRRSLELAEANGCKSLAFSAISTGVYGYPSDEAAEHAVSEVRDYFEEGKGTELDLVVFCNFLQKDETAYKNTLP